MLLYSLGFIDKTILSPLIVTDSASLELLRAVTSRKTTDCVEEDETYLFILLALFLLLLPVPIPAMTPLPMLVLPPFMPPLPLVLRTGRARRRP